MSVMKLYLGTWQSAPSDGFWNGQSLSESENVISYAVKLGITGFDTAQSYGRGQAEQTLRKILSRFPAFSFNVDTKIMPGIKEPRDILKPSLDRLLGGKNRNIKENNAKFDTAGNIAGNTAGETNISLDCLYLHWPKSGFDNLSFLKKMDRLKEDGTIRKLGICNIPQPLLEDFLRKGLKPDRIQIPHSLLWKRDFEEISALCRENNIETAIYSPTGMGLLSGRYREASDLNDARKELFCFSYTCKNAFMDLLDCLCETAKRHEVSCTRVALAWSMAQNPDIIIIGARNVQQIKENLKEPVELSDSEISDLNIASDKLDKASRNCKNIFSYNW